MGIQTWIRQCVRFKVMVVFTVVFIDRVLAVFGLKSLNDGIR